MCGHEFADEATLRGVGTCAQTKNRQRKRTDTKAAGFQLNQPELQPPVLSACRPTSQPLSPARCLPAAQHYPADNRQASGHGRQHTACGGLATAVGPAELARTPVNIQAATHIIGPAARARGAAGAALTALPRKAEGARPAGAMEKAEADATKAARRAHVLVNMATGRVDWLRDC